MVNDTPGGATGNLLPVRADGIKDTGRQAARGTRRLYPHYCVVQVNNVFNMPKKLGDKRWVAYPHPQVIFQYFNGRTGELDYAEAVSVDR